MLRVLSHSRYKEWAKYGVLDVGNLPQHLSQLIHAGRGVQSLPHDLTFSKLEEEGPTPDMNMQRASLYAAR